MRRVHFVYLLSLFGALACSSDRTPRADSVRSADSAVSIQSGTTLLERCEEAEREGGPCTLWGPSLIELIARPELYDGKRVRVIGFVNFEFEGNALYVSQEDWLQGITPNGVWLDPQLALPAGIERDTTSPYYRPNRRYALLEGKFHGGPGGHLSMWSGSIDSITRIQAWGRAPESVSARQSR